MVFEHVVAALVHSSRHERFASPGCSDRTIRRRVAGRAAAAAVTERLHHSVLAQFDSEIGLDLTELAVDGCITKALCGGEAAVRSPVDHGKLGLKRPAATDGRGIPLHLAAAGPNRHDLPLFAPTLAG